jgi:sec-independent protein translocase protein TatA
MGAFSIWHWIIVLIVVLILFGGKGKLSSIMGDFGKGLKNFKDQVKSNKDNEEEVEVISEQKASPKKKTVKKSAKKKQSLKKKS